MDVYLYWSYFDFVLAFLPRPSGRGGDVLMVFAGL